MASLKTLEDKIENVYIQAMVDVKKKMEDFNSKHEVKNEIHLQELADGKITQADYEAWLRGQVFQGKQWQAKLDSVTNTYYNANKVAAKIINKETQGVFMHNANLMSYEMENGVGLDLSLGVYDTRTVARLIKDNPDLLPTYKVDKAKDFAWNQKQITAQVTQGIIQGEKLDDIATRFQKVGVANRNSALTHARTSMTGAQNAGREQSLKDAVGLGINVKKVWMATFDERTRSSHRQLDGEAIPVGDKWHHYTFSNGLRYPADPNGAPWEVYNCRCTLVSEVVDYPSEYERYDNINGKPVKEMTYNEWYKAKTGKDLAVSTPTKLTIDYTMYGGKEIFDIMEKYGSYEEFENNSTADEFDKVWGQFGSVYDTSKAFDAAQNDFKASKKSSVAADKLTKAEAKAKKEAEAKLAKVQAEVDSAKAQMDQMISDYGSWKGIWFKDVTLEDYPSKLADGSIQKKMEWYKEHIETSNLPDKVEEWESLLEDLEEYNILGKQYLKLRTQYSEVLKELQSLTPKPTSRFGTDAYTQVRKDAAIWAKSPREADTIFRQNTKDVWVTATDEQKYAAWDYTAGSGKFNRPLRGYDGTWYNPKGIGKVALDNEGAAKEIGDLTKLLEGSTLKQDTWLQRGIETIDGLSNFVGVPESTLKTASQSDLEQLLLGKEISDAAFMSCGSSKDTGFDGSILNIYCPKGTQAMYVEPFSRYGRGGGKDWDGVSDQSSFGGELETLLQRNSYYSITKVEVAVDKYGDRQIYLDIDLVDQRPWEIQYK